jgi:putative transposase
VSPNLGAMSWKETSSVEERSSFIEAWSRRNRPWVVELARLYGISEKTAHKWIARFKEGGWPNLEDRCRRPHRSPLATDAGVRRLVIEFRNEHPTWGPKKIIAGLLRANRGLRLPSASTVGAILAAEGLVQKRVRRSGRRGPRVEPFAAVKLPNDLWNIDHKGEFTVERRRCYPLTLTDACSRYLLACQGCPSTAGEHVFPILQQTFRERGLPLRVRSDNGPPFGSTGIGGLSRLSVYLTRLGIQQEFITPGEPQENGIHERMHRTLKQEAVLPALSTWADQQHRFDRFREEYNLERPHEALMMKTPNDIYRDAPRPFPKQLPSIFYPTAFVVRRVKRGGEIRWRGGFTFLAEALRGEYVGLQESDRDGWWHLRFGPWDLGLLGSDGTLAKRPRALWTPTQSSPMSPV